MKLKTRDAQSYLGAAVILEVGGVGDQCEIDGWPAVVLQGGEWKKKAR